MTEERDLYVPAQARPATRPAELAAGAVVYAVGLALLGLAGRWVLVLGRRSAPTGTRPGRAVVSSTSRASS